MILTIEDFIAEQARELELFVAKHFTKVRADALGLDPRAGYCLYVNEDAIAVEVSNVMQLDYYGGFEYVSKYSRKESCGYVFYMRDDDRVEYAIEKWQKVLDTDIEFA